jgi:hypothetical protein
LYLWNIKFTNSDNQEFSWSISGTPSTYFTAVTEFNAENTGYLNPMYKFDNTDNSTWNTVAGTFNNLTAGKYTLKFDYYVSKAITLDSNSATNNRTFKTKVGNNSSSNDGDEYITTTGRVTTYSRTFTTTGTTAYFEIGARRKSTNNFIVYAWNIRLEDDSGNEYKTFYSIGNSVTKMAYDPVLTQEYEKEMYTLDAKDETWVTLSEIISGFKENDKITVSFDCYVDSNTELSGNSNSGKIFVFDTNITDDQFITKNGYSRQSFDITYGTSGGGDLKIEFKTCLKSGDAFKVYISNIKVTINGADTNLVHSYFTPANTGYLTVSAYDEATFIKGAMPVVLGAKIKTDLSKVDAEQKLRIDVDFTNINEFADIKEYGVIAVPANKADMTLSDILDTNSSQQVTQHKEADGDAGLVSVIVTRGVNSYGKRIALVAYVKTANGTYYTDVISKSVMGVMKSIFSSETNLATEGITPDEITTAHSSIVKNDIITGKTVDQISEIFKGYTGYQGAEITINVVATDYENAKKITVATFFYAKKS